MKELIANLYETLDHADGVGLAAPQVGLNIRVVVINLDIVSDDIPELKGYIHTFINPHVIETNDEMEDMEEGCLSLPGIHERVRRPTKVHVRYLDENFQEHDEWKEGYVARVMQHEFDHLDGKLFIDYLSPLRRQLIRGKLNAMLKGKARSSYKMKQVKK